MPQKTQPLGFGRVDPHELHSIDFTLPPDPELKVKNLKAAKGEGELQVHVVVLNGDVKNGSERSIRSKPKTRTFWISM